MRTYIVLGIFFCAILSGCQSCNSPAGPSNNGGGGASPTVTPTPTTLIHETYEPLPYTGNWLAPDPFAQLAGQFGGAGAGSYCIAFSSSGLNATTNDHFRNTFGTVAPGVPLTTSFMYNADNLNASGTENLKLHLQMSDNLVKWSFEIVGQGVAYRFNNVTLTACAHCPAAASGWHKLTVVSTGNVTSSLAFDANASEPAFTATYSSGTTPDILGLDILHITTGNCLNATGAKFLLDEFIVTTP